ncbi:C2H2-type zinc finger-containing protein [Cavenderia fasciculata]|uniref:C2H2-type zinc finger-containing protein n=1 Tax=Cavenderia fasciculata TaxID=261658 RepID=F4PQV1_CACFS|nr:C2H2-type zinc finger-containing protein [Cavenderia fasciculata]EGG21216.1 C2H2-type zinc finger-containing protein [Cavenderia fasciculata]|eukprot:XP_004359066.1 C2H2-type zinc finger-containing protein [Cavenderia fasciculata]
MVKSRWEEEEEESNDGHRSRYVKTTTSNSTAAGATTPPQPSTSNAASEEVDAVDDMGRPLRPGREESSDSDSDRDYKYRGRGRGSSRRDYDRYSPDRNRKREHSPQGDKRRGERSPSPSYRDNRRTRREDSSWTENGGGVGGGGGGGGIYRDPRSIRSTNGGSSHDRPLDTDVRMGGAGSSPSSIIPSGMGRGRGRGGDLFDGACKTYKQFLDYQDDSITPTDAEKRYDEYRTEFLKKQSRVFFKDHQTEEWFREKYDPSFLIKKHKEKIEFAKNRVQPFINLLKDESHNFSLTAKDSLKDIAIHDGSEHFDSLDADEHHATDDEKEQEDKTKEQQNNKQLSTLFIKAISPTCTKDDLMEVFNKVVVGNEEELPVVTKLTLSEPMKYKNFYRLGWVTFKSSEYSLKALKELNGTKMRDFDLYLAINKQIPSDTQKKFRITPKIASTEQRITSDLSQAIDVCKLLDQDREITENPLFNDSNFDSLSESDKLDKVIHYLRFVHLFCYYCSEEYADVDEIERKCGSVHYRRPWTDDSITSSTTTSSSKAEEKSNEPQAKSDSSEEESNETKEKLESGDQDTETKMEDDSITTTSTTTDNNNNNNNNNIQMEIEKPTDSDNQWVINLDNNIKSKIAKINNQEQYTGRNAIEKAAEEFIQINTFKIEEAKFRCSLCAKLFKGSEYVNKHIHLKHPEELKKDSEDKGTEEQFFLNYFSDPRKMTPPTANQQMLYGFQNNRMVGAPRGRWNPTLGVWEPIVGMPQMIPTLVQPGQPMGMYGGVSPVFASPSVHGRGRAIPLPIPLPIRRGNFVPTPGAPQMPPHLMGNAQVTTPQGIRYRPYPALGQPRGTPNMPPQDPRGIREYVDLDLPSDTMPDIDYRSALKDYQSKRTTQS